MPRRTKKRTSKGVIPLLERLARAELVHRAGDDELAFVFKNALTQEAAYAALLNMRRRELHLRVAEAYEASYPTELDEYAALLAHHYAQAGDDDRTLAYAIRAGDRALRFYASGEAMDQYDRALAIAKKRTGNTEQLIHLFTRRGRACELRGDYAAALGVYGEMYVFARERGDTHLELEALILLATAYAVGGFVVNPTQALSLSDDALVLARRMGDRRAEARIYWNLMLVHRFHGEGPAKAVEYGERALAQARELGLDELQGLILSDLALAYGLTGQVEKSNAVAPEAIAVWRKLDNKPMLASALAGLGGGRLLQGQLAEALALGEEAVALDESIDNRWGKSISAWLLSLCYREAGKVGRALALLEEAVRLSEEFGIETIFAMSVDLAWTHIVLGDLDRAWQVTETILALEGARQSDSHDWPLALQARICLFRGEIAKAETLVAQMAPASSLVDPSRMVSMASTTLLVVRLEMAFARGEFEQILALSAQASAEFARGGIPLPSLDLIYLQGRALLRLGRTEEAITRLRAGRDLARAIGSRIRLWPLLLTLSRAEADRGDMDRAREGRAEAEETIRYIADQIDRPEVREHWLRFASEREAEEWRV